MDHTHNIIIRKEFTFRVSSPSVLSLQEATVFCPHDMKRLLYGLQRKATATAQCALKMHFKFRCELW